MWKVLKIYVISIAGLFLTTVLIILIISWCIPRPMRYDLPDGYTGWLDIVYDDSRCQPLGTDGITLVLVVSPDGRACSSSSRPPCLLIEWGSYVREDGTRATVRAKWIATAGDNRSFVFVGTAGDRRNAGPMP
jgi:hypothetical protein